MNDTGAAEPEQSEIGTDLLALYDDGDYEGLLAAVEAEWDTRDAEDRFFCAAMAAKAAVRLGQRNVGMEWLARVPAAGPTRFDHLMLADANAMLGRTEEAREHHREALKAPAPPDDDIADIADALEVAVAARLGEDLGILGPLSADRLASADARDRRPTASPLSGSFGTRTGMRPSPCASGRRRGCVPGPSSRTSGYGWPGRLRALDGPTWWCGG